METMDAIRARRKVQSYSDEPIPEEALRQILEAGRRSPSSRNQQRWAFVLVQDRDRLEQLSKVWRGAGHIEDAAAAVAIAAPRGETQDEVASINYDLGQATMSMMIAATGLGVGTRHASVKDKELGASILSLPDEWSLEWLIGLGYPGDGPIKPLDAHDRRPYDEVVHLEVW